MEQGIKSWLKKKQLFASYTFAHSRVEDVFLIFSHLAELCVCGRQSCIYRSYEARLIFFRALFLIPVGGGSTGWMGWNLVSFKRILDRKLKLFGGKLYDEVVGIQVSF